MLQNTQMATAQTFQVMKGYATNSELLALKKYNLCTAENLLYVRTLQQC
jgi:hypothetical protein